MRYKRHKDFKPMIQGDVFEDQVLDITVPVRARSTDPGTSHAAARGYAKGGRANSHRQMVLRALRQHPGSTGRELAHAMAESALERSKVYDICHRRLPELREAGLVRNGEARACAVALRLSLPWYPTTDEGPETAPL